MDEAGIDPELQRFLFEQIDSYEQLESLLYLGREPSDEHTADEVARAVKMPAAAVSAALQVLHERGFLSKSGASPNPAFGYAPREARLRDATQKLVRAYRTNPLDIIRIMSANSVARVRTSALHAFTDAFLLRKRSKDG